MNSRIRRAINTAIVHAMAGLKAGITSLARYRKTGDCLVERTCEHEERLLVSEREHFVSPKENFNQVPLSASGKFNMATRQLPLPLGIIRFSDICSSTENPVINHE